MSLAPCGVESFSDVQGQPVKAGGKELDTPVFKPEVHLLGDWQMRVACSCHRYLTRDVLAAACGQAPHVDSGVGQVRQIRAQLVAVRVVVVGAGFRAHQKRATVAEARVGPQGPDHAEDFSIREAKVEKARDVVDQQENFGFGRVVPDEAMELVQNLRREAGKTIFAFGFRRHGKEAERMRTVGERTFDEALQQLQATEGVEGVFGGVRFEVYAHFLTHTGEESVVVDEIELEHPATRFEVEHQHVIEHEGVLYDVIAGNNNKPPWQRLIVEVQKRI